MLTRLFSRENIERSMNKKIRKQNTLRIVNVIIAAFVCYKIEPYSLLISYGLKIIPIALGVALVIASAIHSILTLHNYQSLYMTFAYTANTMFASILMRTNEFGVTVCGGIWLLFILKMYLDEKSIPERALEYLAQLNNKGEDESCQK